MNDSAEKDHSMSPPAVTPDQIITYGKMCQRPLQLEASVVAYFQEVFKRQKVSPRRVVRSRIKPN